MPRNRAARKSGRKSPALPPARRRSRPAGPPPPFRQPAIQHRHAVVAEQAHHPPAPRGREQALLVVEHDGARVADAERADQFGEAAGGRHHVRQDGFGIGDFVDVEEAGARDAAGAELGPGVLASVGRYRLASSTPRSGRPVWRARRGRPGFGHGWFLSGQRDGDAAVLAALVLDFCNPPRPISAVLATWVPPQGWRSTGGSPAPTRTSRSRPGPRGGLTDSVRTSAGLSSSTGSSTHSARTG